MNDSPICGVVTPPKDFTRAIEALGPIAKRRFEELRAQSGGIVTPRILAKAADYGREHGES